MKSAALMVVVCFFSVMFNLVSHQAKPSVAAASLAVTQGQCFDFDPNETVNCNGPCDPVKNITMSAGYFSGTGIYALEQRVATCKGDYPSCQDGPYYYFERVPWTPCCDLDNDGYHGSQCGGNDCNDNNSSIHPTATETCNFVDDDCDGQTDEGFDLDGDGYKTCENDCDDFNSYINPGADPCQMCGTVEDVNCNGEPDYWECGQCQYSPIVVDVQGNGFNLTNPSFGINFDLNSDGVKERLSWTAANSDDNWLVLDRNSNGFIDNGQELFGNFTPQPAPPPGVTKNGFLALAVYDKPSNGGNNDGQIDYRDTIFTALRLWQDANHNGISEPTELRTLPAVGLAVIDLDYKESRRTDQHGNLFKYRAKVKDVRGAQIGRWAWDVFLMRGR